MTDPQQSETPDRRCDAPDCVNLIPTGSRSDRRYCSTACQVAAWRARQRNPGWTGVARNVTTMTDTGRPR